MCSQTFTDEECPEEWPKDVNPDGSYGPIPCETCPEWRTFTMTYISWDDRPMLLPWTPEYLARLERRRVGRTTDAMLVEALVSASVYMDAHLKGALQ